MRNIDRQTSEQGDSKYPKPKTFFQEVGGRGEGNIKKYITDIDVYDHPPSLTYLHVKTI